MDAETTQGRLRLSSFPQWSPLGAHRRLPKTAFSRLPPVHRTDVESRVPVEIPRFAKPTMNDQFCAFRPAGVDVKRSFRIAARTLPWREEWASLLAKRAAAFSKSRCLNRAVRSGNGRTIVKLVEFSAHHHGHSAQRFMPKVRNLARARPWSSSALVASPWAAVMSPRVRNPWPCSGPRSSSCASS
jgi:hypothetical protein